MKAGLKSVLSLLLIPVFILSFTACGGSATPPDSSNSTAAASTSASQKPKEVVPLKVTMFVDWYLQGWQAIEKDVNDNAEKLGFKLDFDKIASGDQGTLVLKTRAATEDFPDVLCYPGVNTIEKDLHISDKLADLTDAEWAGNYDASFLSGGQYTKDGKLYGAPLGGITIPGVFYNKKVFNDLGINIPNTWEEFLAVCEKVKTAGKVPIFMAGKDTWTVQIFNIMGLQREIKGKDPMQFAKDLNENKVNITSFSLFKDSFAKLKELKDKGYFQKNWLSDSYDAQQKAITDGSAAMVINATWILDEIIKKYPEQINDIGAFTVPFDGDDPVGAWTPNAIFAFNTSKNAEAAKTFINYFESVDTQNKYFAAQPGISAMKGLSLDAVSSSAKDLYSLFTAPGRGQINWQSAGIQPDIGSIPDFSMAALVSGKTPDQLLQEMRKAMEKSAKAQGLAGW